MVGYLADCVPDTEPSVEDCAPDCEAPVEDCANDDKAPVVDHLLPLEDCVLDVEAPDVDCAWPKVNCVSDTDDVGQAAIGVDWQGSWSLEGVIISQIFWNFFTLGSYVHNYLNLLPLNIGIHVLPSLLYTFPKLLTRNIF